MPEGHYLTMYVSHAFPGDATATGPSALQSLLEHARNCGFEVAGDYYEESVCRWPQVFDEGGEILVHCCRCGRGSGGRASRRRADCPWARTEPRLSWPIGSFRRVSWTEPRLLWPIFRTAW